MKRAKALFFIFTQLKIARSIILAIFNTNYLYST